jgi:hypothetical protein
MTTFLGGVGVLLSHFSAQHRGAKMGHPGFLLIDAEKQILRLRCAPLKMTTFSGVPKTLFTEGRC